MSMNMVGRSTEFRVKAGSTATLQITVTDNSGTAKIVSYTLTSTDTAIANAGNWSGEVELLDSSSVISEQTKTFNFSIEESY